MGWHGMGGSLGIALGPAFVGVALATGWPWRTTAALLILPALLGLAWLSAGRLPTSRASPSEARGASLRSLASLGFGRTLLVYFFAGIAYQGSLTFLPKFIGPGLFALALGLGAIGQVIAGTLADRRRPDRILASLSFAGAGLLILLAAVGVSVGFLASVIVFYAYLVQKFILYVGFALAPIFIGFLAVRTLHSIGVAFLLGYAGVLCWPIGWGAASILTSGLIGFMTDQSFDIEALMELPTILELKALGAGDEQSLMNRSTPAQLAGSKAGPD